MIEAAGLEGDDDVKRFIEAAGVAEDAAVGFDDFGVEWIDPGGFVDVGLRRCVARHFGHHGAMEDQKFLEAGFDLIEQRSASSARPAPVSAQALRIAPVMPSKLSAPS